jgi:hypothetical protein
MQYHPHSAIKQITDSDRSLSELYTYKRIMF